MRVGLQVELLSCCRVFSLNAVSSAPSFLVPRLPCWLQPLPSQGDRPQGPRQSTLAEALQQQQQQQAQPPPLNLKPLKVKTSRGAAAAPGTKTLQPAAAPLQLGQRSKSAQLPVPPPGSGGDDSARGGALAHRSQSSPKKASPTLEIPVAAR